MSGRKGLSGRKKEGSQHPMPSTLEANRLKAEILDLIDQGEVTTLTEAARKLEISPSRTYRWSKTDEEWRKQVYEAREIVADELEKLLRDSKNVVAWIFLLKGLRPEMYRDNYRFEVKDERTKELLEELKKLGQQPQEALPEAPEPKMLPQAEEDNPFAEVIARIKQEEA